MQSNDRSVDVNEKASEISIRDTRGWKGLVLGSQAQGPKTSSPDFNQWEQKQRVKGNELRYHGRKAFVSHPADISHVYAIVQLLASLPKHAASCGRPSASLFKRFDDTYFHFRSIFQSL